MSPGDFLLDRSPRERLVLGIAGAGLAIAIVFAFAWLPLTAARQHLGAELPALRASLATLERQADEAKRLRAMPAVASTAAEPLAAAVNARPIAGAQVALVDPKSVAVTGNDVAFGALLEWIAAMQASQGLRVESARIEALAAPGRVRVELRLSKA